MKNKMLISVITPVYNSEKFLRKCISSVISQTYTNFELLLIDDGSLDNSGDICDIYAAEDPRVKAYHKENGGVSSARNYGLNLAKGEYVLFLDSDDYLSRDALALCEQSLQKNNLDILQFSIQGVTSNGETTDKTTLMRHTTNIFNPEDYITKGQMQVCVGGSCIRRSVIENNNIRFNQNLRLAEDQLFILLAIICSDRIKYENIILYYYLDNPNSATHINKSCDIIQSIQAICDFTEKFPKCEKILNKQVLNFVCLLLRNRDVRIRDISTLVKDRPFIYSEDLRISEKMFLILSKINFTFACLVMQFIFIIYDYCKK